MEHACFESMDAELRYNLDPVAFNSLLTEPSFVGQGCSQQCGSDCYAYFIVERKEIEKKTIWGISPARVSFKNSYADGVQVCEGPTAWNAYYWIMKWKNAYWYCDWNGKRLNGQKCYLRFKGARAYRNPSF